MFQFPTFASCLNRMSSLQLDGLPHSEIRGLKVICTYPQLIAAYHVLLRLWEPRYPPFALIFLFLIIWIDVILDRNRQSDKIEIDGLTSCNTTTAVYIFLVTYINMSKIFLRMDNGQLTIDNEWLAMQRTVNSSISALLSISENRT